ncbi:MAG: DNA polymerase/3'-5' exonuclease PolX [Acidobacteria bacterium]|nr:DNA polymerase/3'-5' exonuclease PolX [Acidobacteriota bacterium]MBI3657490.1 DNA polymerase/3'-5' exonuclease PolX [Acidobacteriota bacterium]
MKITLENWEIARVLQETADLLEIKGENTFKIRAIRMAADVVESYTESLSDIVYRGSKDLRDVPGIGEGLAKKIHEIATTGDTAERRALFEELPRSLLEILKLPGVGPKKVKAFYDQLKIATVDGLEAAARAQRLRHLPGFGEKTETKILAGIESYRRDQGRYPLWEIEPVAEALLAHLRALPQVQRMEIAGSYRRRRETVADLDILVSCAEAPTVMKHFVAYRQVKSVLLEGPTKTTVVFNSGLQVDLRVVEPESFAAALVYFTGSKNHNIAMRDMAKRQDLKVNEYGVFRLAGANEERLPTPSEKEVYSLLGLAYVPPEMRENTGELERAAQRQLPHLITIKDILGDLHMHTVASDGKNSIMEMAEAAQQRGLRYIAITDHSKSTYVANGLDEKRLLDHIKAIDQVNDTLEGIRVLKGLECDIRPDGQLDIDNEVLAQLDVVLISIHSHMGMPREEMTDRILRAFANPYAHIFAHPTGRLVKQRDAYPIEMERVMEAALHYKVALELDAFPTRLDLNDVYCRMAKERGVKLTIDTDSHMREHLVNVTYGINVARRAWLEKSDVLNTQPVGAFLKSLRHW